MKTKLWLAMVLLLVLVITGTGFAVAPAATAGEWYAEYFNNPTLSSGPTLTRYDAGVAFTWGTGNPGAGIPADHFSARWTRDEWFEAGTYRFTYRSDDGIRVWVGDTLVIDDWRERQATVSIVDRYIPRGVHRVRVEYYEHTGDATVQLGWERLQAGSGWYGEFFGNRDLSGPVLFSRYDAAIDFDWGTGSPDPAVPADNFSARWTRNVSFASGTYRFFANSDDGVRVYVNGQRILDAWQDQKQLNGFQADLNLAAGTHSIMVEYYEHGGEASVHVWWERASTVSDGWAARYYDNPAMAGGPALTRTDAEINFDWGEGAPASWMPSDNFAAVWTRQINFTPGLYRFNFRADDGVRLWLNDRELLMDYWQPQDYIWRYRDWHYLSGTQTVRVEYFDATGSARVQFWWDYAATVAAARAMAPAPTYRAPRIGAVPGAPTAPPPTTAPAATPIATTQGAPGPWTIHYYDNATLAGTPVITLRDHDAPLSFDWGMGSPDPKVPVDNFSAVFEQTARFTAGRYTFSTYSDDGVRLYVDGQRIIDSWRPMRGARSATVTLTEGEHTIRLEYYERTGAAQVRLSWRKP